MCNFFSCIVDKNKNVYWKEGVNNHHELVEMFDLDDSHEHQEEMKIARIEITPSKKFPFELDKLDFVIDERYKPIWFTSAHEEACKKELKDCAGDIKVHFPGDLDLRRYDHPLPDGLKNIDGYLNLEGYKYKLPNGFNSCGGNLYLGGYNHPLPDGFNSCGGYLNLGGYNHQLPEKLIKSRKNRID